MVTRGLFQQIESGNTNAKHNFIENGDIVEIYTYNDILLWDMEVVIFLAMRQKRERERGGWKAKDSEDRKVHTNSNAQMD